MPSPQGNDPVQRNNDTGRWNLKGVKSGARPSRLDQTPAKPQNHSIPTPSKPVNKTSGGPS